MNQQNTLQRVTDILKEKGSTDEQIIEFIENLMKQCYADLYTSAMEEFTDEDLAAIEAISDDEESKKKIKEIYIARFGKDPDVVIQDNLEAFVNGFAEEYEKEKSLPSS